MSRRPTWPRLRADGDEARHLLVSRSGRLLVGAVVAIALFTVIGLAALWPYGWESPPDSATRTVGATVERVTDEACGGGGGVMCRTIVARVEGRDVTIGLGRVANAPRVEAGDAVRLMRPGDAGVAPASGAFVDYHFAEVDRRGSLLWIAVVLVLAAAVALRWRGVLAVVGVGLSVAILLKFVVPAILAGKPALLVALVASLAVMFVTLVLTNGLGVQTLAAALGVSATLVLACLLALVTVRFADIDGTSDLEVLRLRAGADFLSLEGVVLAGMLIAALGVLADTAVTQASAVMALRRANPAYGLRQLFGEAFVVGRDHLSATIHTLVLAYAGTSLPLLLSVSAGGTPTLDAINAQSLAGPIVATAVGCLALIAAVPLASAVASALLVRLPIEALPAAHSHHHH
jgi:uncharacterized membrane protein